MRWPRWMMLWHRPAPDGHAAAAAKAEAERKLDATRRHGQQQTRRAIDSFTAEVERALRGNR